MQFRRLGDSLQRIRVPRLQCRNEEDLFEQRDVALPGLVADIDAAAELRVVDQPPGMLRQESAETQQSCHEPPFGRDAREARFFTAGRRPRSETFDISLVEPGLVSGIKATECRPVGSSLLAKDAFRKKSGLRSAENRLRLDLAADDTNCSV